MPSKVRPTNTGDAGTKLDVFAMRTQVAPSEPLVGSDNAVSVAWSPVTMRPPTLPRKLHKEGIDLTFWACVLNNQIASDGVYTPSSSSPQRVSQAVAV